MSALCEHLAYNIDDATRTVTVVYIGKLTDDEVIDFYIGLNNRLAQMPAYDYLLDMRYTDWRASPHMIAKLGELFNPNSAGLQRRIAIVRKDSALMNQRQETALSEGLKNRVIRYFTDMAVAQTWLQTQ